MKLSKRLKALSDFIPNESHVIDVGADHAYLDIYLNLYKKCDCLALDKSKCCVKTASENAKKYTANIKVAINDGLKGIPLNNEIIVISGMGTKNIIKILSIDINNDLVLSSHTDINLLKEFLNSKSYNIVKEITINDGKIYNIIYAKKVNKKS